MMYPRLKLLHRLLSDDGVIFISIDDNELYNLKIICDEILGKDCFVARITWHNNFSPRNDAQGIPYTTDNILVYGKVPNWSPKRLSRSEDMDARFKSPDNDPVPWTSSPAHAPSASTHRGMVYAIQHPYTGEFFYPPIGRCWALEQSKVLDLMNEWANYELKLLDDAATRAKICGEEKIVRSLMNGVDSEEIIAEGLGDDSRIIYSLIRIASRRSGNDIRFELPSGAKMGILFGEKGSSAVSERMEAISRLFDDAGIVSHTSENIILDIWLKFASNICMNLPQAVLGVGIGANTDSEYVKDLEHKLNEETINVAEAMGIHMRGIDEGSFRQGYVPSSFIRYSTLQDLDAGRHTEIEMFSGALIRLGKKYSVPTPYNEVVYDCIKALEEKNDGKFDYPCE